MRSKMMRVLALLIVCATLFTACSQKQQEQSSNEAPKTAAKNPVDISEPYPVKNALHKISVTDSDRPLVTNGTTEYRIISGTDSKTVEAVNYLIKYFQKGTGVSLKTATVDEYTKNGKFIVFNVPELFDVAGLTMPEDEIGSAGYYIKTEGDDVFIATGFPGAQFGMLAFLKHVLGFTMYSLDTIVYTKDGATLPDMEIIERPDIEKFMSNNSVGGYEAAYMMGFSSFNEFIYVRGAQWHNTLLVLPTNEYMNDHPKWYSSYGNDVCFTAHGDEAELNAMIQEVAKILMEEATKEENLNKQYISFTTMDINQACECDACLAVKAKYNGTASAAMIQFANRLSRVIQAELQKMADAAGTSKRDLDLLVFAYKAYTVAPAVEKEDGKYEPIDETVVCDPEVVVYYAPIRAKFTVPFTNYVNIDFEKATRSWGACGQKIFTWSYETNFSHYMYPYNNWDSVAETYRFLLDQGSVYVTSQGQWNTTGHTGFTDFKDYINACATLDLSRSFADVKQEFFTNYYREASAPMLQYFDELSAYMRYIEETYPAEYSGGLYDNIEQSKFWPSSLLFRWQDLLDEAYAAIEVHKNNNSLYQTLKNHIDLESIFIRYALITHHGGKFSSTELKEMQSAFAEDCTRLGVKRYAEGSEIAAIFERWGIQ